jgi:hypothetical protein
MHRVDRTKPTKKCKLILTSQRSAYKSGKINEMEKEDDGTEVVTSVSDYVQFNY